MKRLHGEFGSCTRKLSFNNPGLSMSFRICIFEFLYGRKLGITLSQLQMLHVTTSPWIGFCQIGVVRSFVQVLPL